MYRSLNDAASHTGDPRYNRGSTAIWYVKPEFGRDFRMGSEFLEAFALPNPKTIGETHILLGSIAAQDRNEVFAIMQGERWSPGGESKQLLQSKGLRHTSMSVGDIIATPAGMWMVDNHGFEKLAKTQATLDLKKLMSMYDVFAGPLKIEGDLVVGGMVTLKGVIPNVDMMIPLNSFGMLYLDEFADEVKQRVQAAEKVIDDAHSKAFYGHK